MATTATPTALFRGAAPTVSTTLYTVPASTNTVVTNIIISNTAAASATATITLDGINLVPTVAIAANSFITIDLKQVLATGKIVAGLASAATVTFNISGVQLT